MSGPLDAQSLELILKQMGITEYEPRVIPQLMEFMHRYLVDIYRDAQCYAEHASRQDKLELDDVKLAIRSKMTYSFVSPPSYEVLKDLAKQRAQQPLPPAPPEGILLPPERLCLTSQNYQVEVRTRPPTPAAQAAIHPPTTISTASIAHPSPTPPQQQQQAVPPCQRSGAHDAPPMYPPRPRGPTCRPLALPRHALHGRPAPQ
ncbi:putative TATA binding protein associated factor 21kDa subunit [Paratrimastix pyriformis]|uniref:TATA binding protein associated factor 21kDa subunit n=1 Tax=Paratrimastix pyriformis TaxID=342808 RepID=A0ABQ8USX5_9EUKA|nr:putative TATA binding protein associated factor 21kDa subunit [Paratrimastix pyriformis]